MRTSWWTVGCATVLALVTAAADQPPAARTSAVSTASDLLIVGPDEPLMDSGDSCTQKCKAGCRHCCGYYGQVEALFLHRDNQSVDQPLVIQVQGEAGVFPGPVLLSTGDLQFDAGTGVRALFGHHVDDCRALEVGYFGLFDTDASATVTGNNSLAIPPDLSLASLDFFAADVMRVNYAIRLNNAEVNCVQQTCDCRLSWLLGLRYLNLEEQFNINSTDLDTGTSDYNIRASNNLYGAQFGARVNRTWDYFGWDCTAKAGLFGNEASQEQFVSDFGGGPGFPPFFLRPQTGNSTGRLAFLGDINVSGWYDLTEVWSIRAGYNLNWIDGVALAPNQLDFTDTPLSGTQLNSAGSLFLHGVNVGLQARW